MLILNSSGWPGNSDFAIGTVRRSNPCDRVMDRAPLGLEPVAEYLNVGPDRHDRNQPPAVAEEEAQNGIMCVQHRYFSNSRATRRSPRAISARASTSNLMPPRAPRDVQFSAAIALEKSRASGISIPFRIA